MLCAWCQVLGAKCLVLMSGLVIHSTLLPCVLQSQACMGHTSRRTSMRSSGFSASNPFSTGLFKKQGWGCLLWVLCPESPKPRESRVSSVFLLHLRQPPPKTYHLSVCLSLCVCVRIGGILLIFFLVPWVFLGSLRFTIRAVSWGFLILCDGLSF